MKISKAFPSRYLKAADLPDGQDVPVTIDHVTMERMEQTNDEKPVCYFRNKERGLVLNCTNANTISEEYGDDTENWQGQPVTLFSTTTDFAGRTVACIRLKVARPTAQPTTQPAFETQETPPVAETSDEIPF